MSATADLFDWQLKVLVPKKFETITDPQQLVQIPFELYPAEVLEAARKALGETKLKTYVVDIYKYALDAKSKSLPVRASQLEGVLLTHQKINKWLASVSQETLLETGVSVVVFQAYANYHQRQVDESEAVLKQLRIMVGLE